MKKILIINGPNLNMLGKREPMVYGQDTLDEIIKETEKKVAGRVELQWFQSNIEGEIVTKIQEAHGSDIDALVINPGGYSHTSVAIHDALKILDVPIVEVHLSQIYARESFRHTLLTAKAASSIMSGFGKHSYYLAVSALLDQKE
ncbi:MAG TPA: type II 3-dehydroquinate dehydratase [Bacteriovoracaceae bacterium]|nr:type II 3-dehydroquinate dehydratase [Bacteriovoracaceae bacterium]